MRTIVLLLLLIWPSYAANQSVGALYGAPSATVAGLPTCNASALNRIYTVTDALTPAIAGIVAGGGAVTVMVRCNGTNWIVG